MPYEITIGEIYIPPFLLVIALAYIATHLMTALIAKLDGYKYVAYPEVADMSLFVLVTLIIGLFIPFV
ncbi:DUF1656 domain-containing protein [Ferrimonas balearica]|uniref:DUF1656 domain-containing protein n=1 Tax=Ferrimonas balearica TaxID=44012 RepID=UPI001C9A296D|nr:DUF1656 domain-containing protein [Ferrimonas balearica]MBY5991095.1 DUF1656 domain-containing protein [Ferrimonas balearica]